MALDYLSGGVFNAVLVMLLCIYANPSNFKVSECLFFTDRIKQGSQFDVILLYS